MSTLRDPNSLGAFLVLPITYSIYYLCIKKGKQAYKVLPDKWLKFILIASTLCLIFTFSRSGLISTLVSVFMLLLLTLKNKRALIKKYAPLALTVIVLAASLLFVARNTYTVQNIILHSDKSTVQEDPNELRLSLSKQVIDHIKKYPLGEGPGTAGIVSIGNPKGPQLTENYYLQIAYEVGIIGFIIFVSIFFIVLARLYSNGLEINTIILATGLGIATFSLLNHSWSNEALALQWWLLAGLAIGFYNTKPNINKKKQIKN
jgi:O-antigen ligase